MIAKRAKLLSTDNQAWFEDEVWALVQQAKRREVLEIPTATAQPKHRVSYTAATWCIIRLSW